MSLNATKPSAQNTFTQIQNTCTGITATIKGAFVTYAANKLTYAQIYNDFIPRIKTAINALPESESFTRELSADLNALAVFMCGAQDYTADFKALEILLDELLVLTESAIPKNSNGYALVLKDTKGGSDSIPEMPEIRDKLNAILAIIG